MCSFIAVFRTDYNTDIVPSSEESQAELTPKNVPHRMFAEYEEIYNAQEKQLKNMSLDSFAENRVHSRPHSRNYNLDEYAASQHSREMESLASRYQQPKPMPPRPRSADFLEYESKKQYRKMANFGHGGSDQFKNRMPSRPKSSLDINSSIDNYYYSEASYAAKMRQSSMYLQNKNLMKAAKGNEGSVLEF